MESWKSSLSDHALKLSSMVNMQWWRRIEATAVSDSPGPAVIFVLPRSRDGSTILPVKGFIDTCTERKKYSMKSDVDLDSEDELRKLDVTWSLLSDEIAKGKGYRNTTAREWAHFLGPAYEDLGLVLREDDRIWSVEDKDEEWLYEQNLRQRGCYRDKGPSNLTFEQMTRQLEKSTCFAPGAQHAQTLIITCTSEHFPNGSLSVEYAPFVYNQNTRADLWNGYEQARECNPELKRRVRKHDPMRKSADGTSWDDFTELAAKIQHSQIALGKVEPSNSSWAESVNAQRIRRPKGTRSTTTDTEAGPPPPYPGQASGSGADSKKAG